MQTRERERERRSKTSRSNSSFKLYTIFLETTRKKGFIGMRTDRVEMTVTADDRVRKRKKRKGGRKEGEREKEREREEEKEKKEVCSPTSAGGISSSTTPCLSRSLVGVLSRWQPRHRVTFPFSTSLLSSFPSFFPFTPLFFHTLYTQTSFFFTTHNCIFIVIDHISSIDNFRFCWNVNAQVNKMSVNRKRREGIIRVHRNRRETLRNNDDYKIPATKSIRNLSCIDTKVQRDCDCTEHISIKTLLNSSYWNITLVTHNRSI